MTLVRFEHMTKRFGDTVALDDVNLEIQPGELFFLLGPSGCGKSTLLRLVAGLHEPSGGRIWFNDRDVTALGTDKRNAVMCFQSYALWPHMTVAENVRFGLKVRGMNRPEQDARLAEVLRLVQMTEYAARKPNQLSGGQQQRVALARALAVNPDCLLLDEPLSNLDAKLRHEMRAEIRRICKEAGFTTIYVTHDQKEALSVADRIAVLRNGKLVQVGTPGELYHKPVDSFVADFIGHTNLIPGTITARDGALLHLTTPAGPVLATAANFAGNGYDPADAGTVGSPRTGGSPVTFPSPDVLISIRPEQMRVARGGAAATAAAAAAADHTPRPNRFLGRVVETTFLGEASEHVLQVGPQRLKVVSAPPMFDVHGDMAVEFDPEDVVVLSR